MPLPNWDTPDHLAEAAHEACGAHPLSVPLDVLKQVARESYDLSLKHDEGRAIRATVCLLESDNLPAQPAVVLAEPMTLTAGNMHRLAPCIPTSAFAFLVRPAKGKAELLGWLRVEKRGIGLTSDELSGTQYEGGLWFRILGPGDLEVWSMHMAVAQEGPFERTVRLTGGTLSYPSHGFQDVLNRLDLTGHPASRMWLRIAPLVQEFGHGGAFVIPAEGEDPMDGIGRCHPVLAPDLSTLVPPPHDSIVSPPGADALQPILDAATCVAHMSATDGCVVVDRGMRVHAFGAEIMVPENDGLQVENRGPIESGLMNISQFGTRHRSAIRYCDAHREAVAIVVSQDRGVTVFHGLGEGPVHRYGPFQHVPPAQVFGATE